MNNRRVKLLSIIMAAVLASSLLAGCTGKKPAVESSIIKETASEETTAKSTRSTEEDKPLEKDSGISAKSQATAEANAKTNTNSRNNSSVNTNTGSTAEKSTSTTSKTSVTASIVSKPAPAPAVQNTSTPAVKPIESQPVQKAIVTQPTASVTVQDDFDTVVKANLEQGRDITIKVSSDIINKGIGRLAIAAAENSGFGGYVDSVQYSLQGDTAFIHFEYKDGREGFLTKCSAVTSKVNNIVSSVVNSGMTDFQKEIALHDYVVNHTSYDTKGLESGSLSSDDYTAYGVLMKGTAVCSGYAEAMYRLLNKAGIKALIVTGTADGIAHAWNIVNIGGSYYQLDATFDDPVSSTGNMLSYNYFNITDTELSKNHVWTRNDYPQCTATSANYFIMNKLYAGNYQQYYDIVKRGLMSKQVDILVKIPVNDTKTYPPDVVVDILRDNPDIGFVDAGKGYSYRYDDVSLTYDFYVAYK
ncbi:MAG: transglutaminase domain-containing protein [Bacillota bacterium]|nr:transglutaminase domain-containing protein [Bacillota bacterium]